jgi:hypothetical protein
VQDGGRRKIVKENPSLNLRLNDCVVNVVREVRVRDEHHKSL